MAHDVFISYSSEDKSTADAACSILESQGLRCWIAPRDILPGSEWTESILDAITQSKAMVLIFSRLANDSPHVRREVERAVHQRIPIVPMRIENVPPTRAMEYLISTTHWMDAISPPLADHLNKLAAVLKSLLQLSKEGNASSPLASPATTAPAAKRSRGVSRGVWIGIATAALIVALVFWALSLKGGNHSSQTADIAATSRAADAVAASNTHAANSITAPASAAPAVTDYLPPPDDQDWQMITWRLSTSMLSTGNLFAPNSDGSKKKVVFGRILNQTSNYFDTNILRNHFTDTLFKSGKVETPSILGGVVNERSPDYTLAGMITELRSRNPTVIQSTFTVHMTLANPQGRTVWEDSASVTKVAVHNSVGL
jgi:hypothetical protein